MSLLFKKEQFIKELKSKLSQKAFGSTIEEIVLLRAFKYFDLKNTGFCTRDVFSRAMLKIGITSLTYDEIASELGISKNGVRWNLDQIIEKGGFNNKHELLAAVIENKLIVTTLKD